MVPLASEHASGFKRRQAPSSPDGTDKEQRRDNARETDFKAGALPPAGQNRGVISHGAERLEGLLYEERNRGVKETLLHPG